MHQSFHSFLKQRLLKLILRSCLAGLILGFACPAVIAQLELPENRLSFAHDSLGFLVEQGGVTTGQPSTLSANRGEPTVSLIKSVNSDWLVLPSDDTGSLLFGINATGLPVGTYTSTVSASASGYADAI